MAGYASEYAHSPSPSHSHSPSLSPRHPLFYIDDTQVVFRIGVRFYKVHRYFLIRESEFFRNMFELPRPPEGQDVSPEGTDDEHAIELVGVTALELESFLQFLYLGMHDDYNPSMGAWLAILSLSTRFICDKVRARAIKEITARLNELDPFDLVRLAIKFDVQQWLHPAYVRIVERTALITLQEAAGLPLEIAVMLMRARERWCEQRPNTTSRYGSYHMTTVESIVREEVRIMDYIPVALPHQGIELFPVAR
ncbi:hypothetical protein OF83DRAFT_1058793 [Amylostereum chailletii]|nr:hypothetical protein OF83DRAFT_1058793 [Amylostereum chailletii]